MNFELRVVGGGPTTLQFRGIDPALPLEDFLGFVVSRLRRDCSGKAFLRHISERVSILREDGSSAVALDSALKPAAGRAPDGPRTVGDGFGFLYDSLDGHGSVGWLHFRDVPMCVRALCRTALATGGVGQQTFDIGGANLLFITVADVKKLIAARLRLPASAIMLLDPSQPAQELHADRDLFALIREEAMVAIAVVRREGFTVHVSTGTQHFSLARLPVDSTVRTVRQRLRAAFAVDAPFLFLEGPTPEVLADDALLVDLTDSGSDVRLTTAPRDLSGTASPVLTEAVSSPTRRALGGATRSTDKREGQHSPRGSRFGSMSTLATQSIPTTPTSFIAQPTQVTARVTIEAPGQPADAEVFDVVLPNDAEPYTALELKEFILQNVLPDAQFHELGIRHSRRLLADADGLQHLLDAEEPSQASVVVLTCTWRRF